MTAEMLPQQVQELGDNVGARAVGVPTLGLGRTLGVPKVISKEAQKPAPNNYEGGQFQTANGH